MDIMKITKRYGNALEMADDRGYPVERISGERYLHGDFLQLERAWRKAVEEFIDKNTADIPVEFNGNLRDVTIDGTWMDGEVTIWYYDDARYEYGDYVSISRENILLELAP